jgi:trimethylamine--corrinoid protein Co-methyltransferase
MFLSRMSLIMARVKLDFLSKEEEDLIHEKSLEILSTIGVLVRSESVLDILGENGSKIDYAKKIAYVPENLVLDAIASAPKRFFLRARNSCNDVGLPTSGLPYLTTDGLTLYIRDSDSGERRDATRKDFGQFAMLADALEAVDFFWPIVTISDVPQAVHNLYELWDSFRNCTLHVQGDCTSARDANRQIELASLVSGGLDELRRKPIFSCAIDPVAPLSFDGGAIEAQVEFARFGIPVLCHSMCIAGMSSPVTIAGTLAIVNAENLASLVITQLASRGAPHIYGSSSAPADMVTGNINFSAPECLMISAGAGQMARRYQRPCMVSDWGAGAKGQGIPSSCSELFGCMASTFGAGDLVPGVGSLDNAKGCSLAQMVIDSVIWDNFRAFARTFSITEETIALDVVREVGHGNSFLGHQHTARKFRDELFFWDDEKLAMESTHTDRMIPKCSEIAKDILGVHTVEALDRSIVSEGEAMLKNYAKSSR